MLNELRKTELGHISGGDIIVTGTPYMPEWQLQSILDRMTSSYMIDSGIKFEGSGGSGNWVDTDGDGVPDSPEIVVQSPLTLSQIRDANQYAINQAQWNYFEAGIIAAIAAKGLTFWASLGISSAMSVPPVSNTVTDANAEFIFASILAAGGLNNYIATNPSTAYNNP